MVNLFSSLNTFGIASKGSHAPKQLSARDLYTKPELFLSHPKDLSSVEALNTKRFTVLA